MIGKLREILENPDFLKWAAFVLAVPGYIWGAVLFSKWSTGKGIDSTVELVRDQTDELQQRQEEYAAKFDALNLRLRLTPGPSFELMQELQKVPKFADWFARYTQELVTIADELEHANSAHTQAGLVLTYSAAQVQKITRALYGLTLTVALSMGAMAALLIYVVWLL